MIHKCVIKHCLDKQGSLQEQEESESESSLTQSPTMQEWLAQAQTTRSQQQEDSLQRQRVYFLFFPLVLPLNRYFSELWGAVLELKLKYPITNNLL